MIFNTRFVQRITTNGTGIGTDIPGPHGHGVPFFNFKARHVSTRRGRSTDLGATNVVFLKCDEGIERDA